MRDPIAEKTTERPAARGPGISPHRSDNKIPWGQQLYQAVTNRRTRCLLHTLLLSLHKHIIFLSSPDYRDDRYREVPLAAARHHRTILSAGPYGLSLYCAGALRELCGQWAAAITVLCLYLSIVLGRCVNYAGSGLRQSLCCVSLVSFLSASVKVLVGDQVSQRRVIGSSAFGVTRVQSTARQQASRAGG
ncbi:hypothetical protein RRG08_013458 [Elysia crispata]|uniref:Uncharacterized protein n=1 Tax=Elysia crispata TaxID=231223 RepID=A0AAE1B7W4_9GAST|nr:hypothetical protein RRG08_013458 [Elysia crispata]